MNGEDDVIDGDDKQENLFGSEVARNRMAMFDDIAGDDDSTPPAEEEASEDTGESDEAKTLRMQAEREAAEKAEIAPVTKKHKLIVDGVEQEVDEEALLQAGRAALQKQSTADKRLEEATRLLNEAKQTKAPQVDERQESAIDAQLIKDIQYGDAAQASAAIQKLLANNSKGMSTETVAQIVAQEARRTEVQTKFRQEFPEVFGDADLMSIAANKLDARLKAGEPNEYATYAAVGKELKEKYKLGEAVKVDPAKTEFDDKLEKKRNVARVPVASGNSGSGKKAEKDESTQDIIGQMRKARKQG